LQSILITPNAESAELVRPSLEDYARRTDSISFQMLDDPDALASVLKSMITDLCHLADAAEIPGDREELVMRAYREYRTECAYEALDTDE
jgi:hypothetical protein